MYKSISRFGNKQQYNILQNICYIQNQGNDENTGSKILSLSRNMKRLSSHVYGDMKAPQISKKSVFINTPNEQEDNNKDSLQNHGGTRVISNQVGRVKDLFKIQSNLFTFEDYASFKKQCEQYDLLDNSLEINSFISQVFSIYTLYQDSLFVNYSEQFYNSLFLLEELVKIVLDSDIFVEICKPYIQVDGLSYEPQLPKLLQNLIFYERNHIQNIVINIVTNKIIWFIQRSKKYEECLLFDYRIDILNEVVLFYGDSTENLLSKLIGMCITAKLLNYQFVRSKTLKYKTFYFIPNLGHLYDLIDGNITKQPYAKIIAPMLQMNEQQYEFIVKKDKTIGNVIKGMAIPCD